MKRDREEIPASRLHGIAAQLRAAINRETGPVAIDFSETGKNIPLEEFVIAEHTWKA